MHHLKRLDKPVHELTVMSAMLIISLMQGGEKVFF
jgi:hypothetical protein